jgi:hypothetical protein
MGEKIMAILKSTTAKLIYLFAAIFCATMFGSWTTQKNIQDTMSSYAKYQFSESVNTVLNQPGGISSQIQEVKTISENTNAEVLKSNSAMYQDWLNDIDKYYAWCDGKHDSMLSLGYVKKMSNYWDNLPDKYKTDIVKAHYEYAFSYITKVTK